MTSPVIKPTVTAVIPVNWTRPAYQDPPTVTPGYVVPAHLDTTWGVVGEHTVHHPAASSWVEDFEDGIDGWDGDPEDFASDGWGYTNTITWSTDHHHLSGHALKMSPGANTHIGGGGLLKSPDNIITEPGAPVTFSMWYYATEDLEEADLEIQTSDTFAGTWNHETVAANQWHQMSFTYTASEESAYVIITSHKTCVIWFDDISVMSGAWDERVTDYGNIDTFVPEQRVAGTMTAGATHAAASQTQVVLQLEEWGLTLSAEGSPYGQFEATIPTPPQPVVDALNPYNNLRGTVTVTEEYVQPVRQTQSTTFNGFFHVITHDSQPDTSTLIFRTDEALLLDDMLASSSIDATFANYTDLRTLVSAVLALYGFTLESGTLTSDITRTADVQNLISNPSVEVNTTNWVTTTANATIGRSGAAIGVPQGSFVLWARPNAGQTACGFFAAPSTSGPYINVSEGTVYRWSFWSSCTTNARQIQPKVRWFNSSGVNIGDATGSTYTLSNTAFQLVTMTATAPAGAVKAAPWCQSVGTWANADILSADVMTFHQAVDAYSSTPTFSGEGAYPSDPHYAYTWDSTSQASTSTRTRLDERSPDSLLRQPGDRMWEWITRITEAAGLRLFCDENRKWRLVSATGYMVDGAVTVAQGVNLLDAQDSIDLGEAQAGSENASLECVVVHFAWTDSKGKAQEKYESAGLAHGRGKREDITGPYPGPGTAATILGRAQGKGHTVAIQGLNDLTLRPGMTVIANLPHTVQTGVCTSVTWTSDGVMTVGLAGVTTTPDTAWSLATGSWTSKASGITWANYTG